MYCLECGKQTKKFGFCCNYCQNTFFFYGARMYHKNNGPRYKFIYYEIRGIIREFYFRHIYVGGE
jgi:hypothetical protein